VTKPKKREKAGGIQSKSVGARRAKQGRGATKVPVEFEMVREIALGLENVEEGCPTARRRSR
jgi:hypothetical protein